MVTVSNFHKVEKKDGTSFFSLELTGSLEMIQSQATGGFYATVRTCRIPSTFTEKVAEQMVGQQIEGSIERVTVDPYDYINKQTGEVMQLQYSWAYRPKGSVELIGHAKVEDLQMA